MTSCSSTSALGHEMRQRPPTSQLSALWRRAEKKYSVCRKDHMKRLFTRHSAGMGDCYNNTSQKQKASTGSMYD